MKISTRGRYGLRVMMELAAHYGQGPMLVDDIAKNQEISGNYIHALVAGLRAAGLVRTIRGPNGGYELARDPATITALDIISVLEGKSEPAPCITDASVCGRTMDCAARDLWCRVAGAIDQVLAETTLRELTVTQSAKDKGLVTFDI